MSKTANAASRGSQSARPTASRALLLRKAVLKLGDLTSTGGGAIEDSFPATDFVGPLLPVVVPAEAGDGGTAECATDDAPSVEYTESSRPVAPQHEAQPATSGFPTTDVAPAPPELPAVAPEWSAKDEALFQTLTNRRKASGFQRRGKDVSGQVIAVGTIAPNPGTVVATIVALVAERGTVGRGELLDAMAVATFPHAKAKPQDRGWCQGYVQGAVRDGYLVTGVVAADALPNDAETSR